MKSPSPLTKSALCLILACAWSGCDRKQPENAAQAPGSGAPATAATAPGAPPPPANALVADAPRLGMAARLPKDTAFYLGSASLKDHREALEKTQYWKTVKDFIQDKKPSAEKKAKKALPPELQDVKIDDFFLAMSPESNASLDWLIDLNRVYSEYTYRTLMTGFTGGGASGSSFDPQAILANASASPDLIEKVCVLLERATLPHVIFGAKTAQADALMKQMFPADPAGRPEWTADLKQGTLTTNTGATFTTYEGNLGIWLTPEKREELLAGLGKTIKQPELLERIKKTLDTVAAKTFSFGVGVSDGYLIGAMGNDLKHVRFAATPAESLLARPDLAKAAQGGKNLLGLVHIDAETITAMHDDQPLSPMLQAALSGLGTTPMFAALAQQLEPKVASLAAAEKDFYKYTFAPLNGALWWDQGLHMAMTGGVTPDGMILDKPLQFGGLLNSPEVVFAAVGHSPVSVTGRAYFERWMDLLYSVAGGLMQAGLGGEQAQAMYGLADKAVIPPLVKIYEASKILYQKGVGTESALVIDLQGKTPLLPGAGEGGEGAGASIPRITAVHTVQDRKAISDAWTAIEGNLNQILQSLPTPMPPMSPMSSEKAGMTTWFFPLAPGGNDLLPCVTLNDKIFMFGTSMNQHQELAEKLNQPAAGAALSGSHYRFSFGPIRTLLKNASALPVPGATAEEVSTALPFIAPFGDLTGRAWVEGGELHNIFHLEAKDVRQVD